MHDLSLRDPVLVGWSFGGAIGQVLAARYPDVLRGMILVSTTWKHVRNGLRNSKLNTEI